VTSLASRFIDHDRDARSLKMSSKSDSKVRLVDCEKRSSSSALSSSAPPSKPPSDARTERFRVSVVVAWTVCALACLLTAWTAVLYWTQLSRLRADVDSLRRDLQHVNQLTADQIDSVVEQVSFLTTHLYYCLFK